MLLSKAFQDLIAASIPLLLIAHTEAHSYADCIDWRFNSKNKSLVDSNGHCTGCPSLPSGCKNLYQADSDDPNRHYQQSHNDPDNASPCSNGCSGEEPRANETMAKTWTAAYNGKDKRGHETGPTRSPRGISDVSPSMNPSHSISTKNIIACLDYKNCTKGGSTDSWPCVGCFKIPTSVKRGHHVLQ
ncbi:hypothetical protein BGZ81_001886 [Podila clonocystis]|nr:hypothetical protein BGZ81_001886 [Podila clonocystis]